MKKYEKYKGSGIKWLDAVPEHWQIKRIKNFLIDTNKVSVTGTEDLLTVSHITGVTLRSEKNVNMFLAETNVGYKKCCPGDIIINTMWAWMGALGACKDAGICSPAYNVYRPIPRIEYHAQYFDYLFRIPNFIIEVTRYSKGIVSSRLRLYPREFYQIQSIIPPLNEQIAIANYLDLKTQIIDRKIELLNNKISYYKELRISLINKVVCRGLNDSVKLRDSGIDRIGKIPEHWKVKRFKDTVLKYTTGGTPSTSNPSYFNGNNIWISISDLNNSKYISDSCVKLSDEAIKINNMIKTPKGSLLYSFKLTIGKMAFTENDVYTNEAILSIFPNKNISLKYYYFMLPIFMLLAATENIYGAKMLNQKLIANALIIHPPKEEQIIIAEFLNTKTQAIEDVVQNIYQQIAKLQELRKTLINDVVTGKIKVTE